ncbi:hypothetical protein ACS0PU_012012 [Formica fusca]
MCTENNNLITTENEFQREVIRKLQLLLNKMTVLENRMVLLETSSCGIVIMKQPMLYSMRSMICHCKLQRH